MKEKQEKILDFKDYDPSKFKKKDYDPGNKAYILEDVEGVKFQFKHKVPTTSEILEFKGVITELSDDGKIVKTNFVKGFNYIVKGNDFNCIPAGLEVDYLTEESIQEVVLGFCRRV
ncbi:MAG: hypothetical protein ACRCYA_00360 [Cetobacterium sp.]|uniref:hypothetical protein n=1 Tax=Cetobacterium sp. TaxID=2071632 RepID=UPI003F380C23